MAANWTGTAENETVKVRPLDLAGARLDGGAGTDALEFVDFTYPGSFDLTAATTVSHFEILRGVLEEARIRVRADQLVDVKTFDSDGTAQRDVFTIVGPSVDLRGKAFIGNLDIALETAGADVLVSTFEAAMLLKSAGAQGLHVHVDGAALTPAQKQALFDRGMDKVTDSSGVTVSAVGLTLTGLDNDAVSYGFGETVLDFGRDAQLTAGSPIASLVVSVRGGAHYDDQLDLDGTLRVKIQAGSVGTDRVFVDSVEIGTAFRDTSSKSLHFDFNAKATPERVQEIVRSLSYEDFYDTPTSGTLTVDITITDGGGRQVKGTSTVYFDAGQIPGLLVEGTANGDILNGTRGADTIKGLAGNDTIFGMSGHDAIYGGEGNDRLTGGPGFDAFVFDTTPNKKTNVDRIMDFQAGGDEIWLDHAVFGRLGSKPGVLKKAHFVKGARALDKNDFVIYDSKKGFLFYDKDGAGGAKAVQIASLKKSLALGHKDFFVI